jgi:hypothetical protein
VFVINVKELNGLSCRKVRGEGTRTKPGSSERERKNENTNKKDRRVNSDPTREFTVNCDCYVEVFKDRLAHPNQVQ